MGSSYTIELSRWGITQGIPTKPYTTNHYNIAKANITGINNALDYAYTNGYSRVVLPRGQYAICYPNPILTKPNMMIDFNFSTLKVIYDSVNRSPFDISTNPVYKFGGSSISCTTEYTDIVNLKLIGDRIERSWIEPDEVNMEFTTGISFGSGANFCSVRNCNISYFMGDAISTGFAPYSHFSVGTFEFGSLSTKGSPISGNTSKSLRSVGYISLPSDIKGLCMIGLGYAPATSIPNGQYNIYFYDANNVFLSYKTDIRTRDYVPVPRNAVKAKITFEGDGTVDAGTTASQNPPYWAILVKNGIGDHLTIENCELHRNHRGAMTVGINNVLVRRNYFHDTGQSSAYDIDGIPNFPDGTRYAINTEDNSGHNCRFIENVFDNIRLAIAIRGEYNEITGNEFRHCTLGVYLYHLKHCIISNNYFYYSTLGGYEYKNFDRHWIISNNVFKGKGFGFGGTGTIDSIVNNTLYNCSSSSPLRILNFSGNTFDNSSYLYIELETVCEQNTFMNGSTVSASGNTSVPFDRIRNCRFLNNSSATLTGNKGELIIRNSHFNESYIKFADNTTYTLIGCTFNNPTKAIVTSPNIWDIGQTHNTVQFISSNISMGQKALISAVCWGKLIIDNSTIIYNLTSDLTTAFLDTYGSITDGIEITNSTITAIGGNASQKADLFDPNDKHNGLYIRLDNNKFTRFSLTEVAVEIQSSVMANKPTTGTFKLGQIVLNANPKKGEYVGWVCTSSGNASNTTWSANTNYTRGSEVSTGGNVYVCTRGGTSGSTPPTGANSAIADGTVIWKYLNPLAILRPYGLIS